MRYQQTTQVPNEVFDIHLPELSGAEYKVFSIIIRQTLGWINPKTKKRKERDRITHGQFVTKTKLSRRKIIEVIHSLCTKKLINITDYSGYNLNTPALRKGKTSIYYSPCIKSYAELTGKVSSNSNNAEQKPSHNKTNISKLTNQKKSVVQGKEKLNDAQRIQQILQQKKLIK